MPDTTVVMPQRWSLRFDLDAPEHCLGSAEDWVSDLSPTLQAALNLPQDRSQFDHNDLRAAIVTALSAANDALEDAESGSDSFTALRALSEELEEAHDTLAGNHTCQCGLDVWDGGEQDYFNEMLDAVSGEQNLTWVQYCGDDVTGQTDGALTVSDLWKSLNSRDGWSAVDLEWDPDSRTLQYSFESYPSIWSGHAVALSAEQRDVMDLLAELDSYLDTPGHVVLSTSPDACALAHALADDAGRYLWTSLDTDDVEVAARILHERLQAVSPDERAVVLALARGWAGTLDDLFATAAGVVKIAA